ncbi:Inherit from bactNOG: outer membrane autotransporter barrel [Seminavis robusta]|uniref:Inherit from bactNOG: outer membrane autotransporter barrel n=1 Tax=Seminavis robusta TaxID=568900 RepID=A0A9N8E5E6_9STRA|nr:Inherit from bactNOG: outer membrane autotransporter barrel [Seminavis robusta]|eukprot:Sro637_g179400.1 Inherit from bactNOG: outer membrane autotransporter barrel (1116) ;mRNA; f:16584-20096
MDLNHNANRSAFHRAEAGSGNINNSNNNRNVDMISPATAPGEFPSTPTTRAGRKTHQQQQSNPKPPPATTRAFVTPSPTSSRGSFATTPMDNNDSDGLVEDNGRHRYDQKALGAVWQVNSNNSNNNKSTMPEKNAAVIRKNMSAGAAGLPPIRDEKTRARKERLVAMEQQEQMQHSNLRVPKLRPGTPDHTTSSPIDGPPLRHDRTAMLIAKEQQKQQHQNKNTHVVPPMTSVLKRRSTTMSSVSSTSSGSTEVTQNTGAARSSLASLQSSFALRQAAVDLALIDDDDDDEGGVGRFTSAYEDDVDSNRAVKTNGSKLTATAAGFKKRRAVRRATTGNGIPRPYSAIANSDNANVKRSASSNLEHCGIARRRRATVAVPYGTHLINSFGGNMIMAEAAEGTGNSHHSNGSSVGAHSVIRGRRAAKKSESEHGDDDDAVALHLASVASRQAQAASGLQFIPNNDDEEDITGVDVEDDTGKPKAVTTSADASTGTLSAHKNVKVASFSTHHASLSQRPALVDSTIMEEEDDDILDDDGDEFANAGPGDEVERPAVEVAQAGVPVLLQTPGAFAVEGMHGAGRANDELNEPFDSDLNHEDRNRDAAAIVINDPTLTDPNSALFIDEELAVNAELYNGDTAPNSGDVLDAHLHVVYEGQHLPEDEIGPSAKSIQRSRMIKFTVFSLAIGAIASAIAVGLSRPSRASANLPWQQVRVPTIEGWKQVGNNLTGPTDDDKSLYGYAIAMAGNADRIAIGVPGRDQGATKLLVGEVHVLDWNGTTWSSSASPIIGPGPDGQAGTSVAMSKNGKRIAVGSPFLAPHGGHVAVYEETDAYPKEWILVGQVLLGNSSKVGGGDSQFGSSVALSENGNRLAVGATMGEDKEGTGREDSGYVKVFQFQRGISNRWVQLGDTMYGEKPGDFFGWSLAMSSNGTRIIAGAVGSTAEGVGEFSGQVRVFNYGDEEDSWTQAAGAIGHSSAEDGVDIGHVRVFRFVETSEDDSEPAWEPLGQMLVGQSAFDSFGYSVSLSADGHVVAAGGPRNDEFSESAGHIQVFEMRPDTGESTWVRRGGNIGGSYDGRDLFGWSVALNSNGTRVAGGAPFSTFDGILSDVGTVRVYDVV